MEMGALDGSTYSASREFLPLGWHRILLEGSPQYRESGPRASPDATFISAVVCQPGVQNAHWLSNPDTQGDTNGIAEFMSPKFMATFHPNVFDAARRSLGILE